jgi:threonine/homoserine/homoserine lactone efflux protein
MIEALIKGITLGLLLSIAVGPVLFSIIKHSINVGHKGGLAFVAGVSASDFTLAIISNVFTALFETIGSHKQVIGIGGSIFLIILGIYFLFFKKVQINEKGKIMEVVMRSRDYVKMFFSGFFMNALNPAVFLFWLTASTTFINHTIRERIVLFSICLLFVLAADTTKVLLAGKIRTRLTPHNIQLINRLSGIILIGFGIVLIYGLVSHRIPV